MIQIEIINSKDENNLVLDVNYFLEQLEEHLFIDIKYSSFLVDKENNLYTYSALIIYRVE